MSQLREALIKLAGEVPETRKHLVPLLKKTAKMFDTIEIRDKDAGVLVKVGLVNDGTWTVFMWDENSRRPGSSRGDSELVDKGRGLFKSRKIQFPRHIMKGIHEAQKELGGV